MLFRSTPIPTTNLGDSVMSLRSDLLDNVFGGKSIEHQICANLASAAPSAGSYPNSRVGQLIKDQTNDNWYITTVAGTTWVKINA